MKRILLTGGGTAGHIWPIISIIEELNKMGNFEILYAGSSSGIENDIIKNYKDFKIPFKRICVGKYRNYLSILNFTDIFKTFFGIIQSFFIITSFKPQIIFAKGGYVTFPIIFWANIFQIPIILHESDSVIGKANKIVFNKARKICTGFPLKYYKEDLKSMVYTGTPVRSEFVSERKIILDKNEPTLLFTGGSQGSLRINEIVWKIVPELIKKYQVIHFVGEKNLGLIPENVLSLNKYHSFGFSRDIVKYIEDADIVISRSGANTLAELSILSKVTIVIPLNNASLNHQNINARILKEEEAVEVLDESNLTGKLLLSTIDELISDKERCNLLKKNINKFSCPDAAKKIAQIILEEIN